MADKKGASSFAARRLGNKGLQVSTEGARKAVAINKRITQLKCPFESLYKQTAMIHDGGKQCRIFKVEDKEDKKEYVVKVQAKKSIRGANEAMFRRMTERMMNMPASENVITVEACFEDNVNFYTLQEACYGGDLFDFFRVYLADDLAPKELENEVRVVAKEMLASLNFLHKQGLVHKDVKLENLVFKKSGGVECTRRSAPAPQGDAPESPRMLKIIDFDFTEEWEPSSPRSKAVVGTDGYIAPEAYLGDVCPKSDVFSAGVVLYVLVAGRFPYDDELFDDGPNENYVGSPKMKEIHTKLKNFKVRYGRVWDGVPEAKEFVASLIEFDLDMRPDAEQALQHPWIKKG